MPNFKHQYDFDGNHRLVVDDVIGEWVGYQFIAANGKYRATTDYYGEEIYEHVTIPNEGVVTVFCICRVCEKPLPPNDIKTNSPEFAELACEHVKHRVEIIRRAFGQA